MTADKTISEKIKRNDAKICIVGLGYVGLPLAEAFSKKNFFVYGFDKSKDKIKKLNKGEKYISDVEPEEITKLIQKNKFYPSNDEKVLGLSDVVVICVPTPLRKVKLPDISYVVASANTIKKYLKRGQLIILESTSYPTTTKEVLLPILESSGLKEGEDFYLCFSPERVNPGDKKYPLTKIPKVVGGISKDSTKLGVSLYSKIIKQVFPVSSPEVAETAKLYENTFRLINIALANEFAVVCDKMGISVWEVIEAAKTKPFGFMPFYPGPGIGGHCIPTDPLYLSWKAKKLGFKTKMIDLAASLNRQMPIYVVERVLKKTKKKLPKILIIGITYKKDIKDLRESPSLDILSELKSREISVDYHDEYIPRLKLVNIQKRSVSLTEKNLRKYDVIIIATDHKYLPYERIKKYGKYIFDTRNVYKGKSKNVEQL